MAAFHIATRKRLRLMCLAAVAGLVWAATARGDEGSVKNVIVMIVDGCSNEQYTFARWYKGPPLALDAIRTGAVWTWIADSVVADSAPAATAFATGQRTSDKLIGVGPRACTLSVFPKPPVELQYRPLATVLEGARLQGKGTGVVVTCRVSHATPAGYLAHVPSRKLDDDIMEQIVYQSPDVVFGGGMQYLLPESDGGKRRDGENLDAELRRRGYEIISTAEQLRKHSRGKVFGLFAKNHMSPELDRAALTPQEPNLEEMTAKAIQLLSQNPRGFFLMVEGSQVDWACHANDPAHMVHDLLAYDRAVKAALDFAARDGHTLVLAFSDHNTGGMTIGNYATSKSYSQMSVESLLDPVKKMKLSAAGMWKKLGNEKTPAMVRRVVKQFWGVEITEEDAQRVLTVSTQDEENPHNGFGEVVCPKHTLIGWTTHGHTGGDVPLHAFGPGSPAGLIDGPELGRITACALGIDLKRLNRRLFVDAALAFPSGKVHVDRQDPANPVVRVQVGEQSAELPVNKNVMKIGGQTELLEGVVVYAPDTDKAYLPQQAVERLQRH
jgi:alkaline phosphatase